MDRLSTEYEAGKIIRVLVDIIGNTKGEKGLAALRQMLSLAEEKLRQFPFLKEDVQRALGT